MLLTGAFLFSVSGVSRLQPKARTAQFCLLVHGGHWGLGPAAKGVGLARQLNKTLGAIPSLFFAAQDAVAAIGLIIFFIFFNSIQL